MQNGKTTGTVTEDCILIPSPYKLCMSDYQRLLKEVLDVVAASLPNKQQHDAARHMIRKAFDRTYDAMLHTTYPDGAFGRDYNSYAVEPQA